MRLLIRTDASTQIGTGHVMRCLALGQACAEVGGEVLFLTAGLNDRLRERICREGFEIRSLGSAEPDWHQIRADWVVVDGYQFTSERQSNIKRAGHRLLTIDDMAHLSHYCADLVLNQNLGAQSFQYSCAPSTELLLGPRYALLRKDFVRWRSWQRRVPVSGRHVLVTLGGSDAENVTVRVLKALRTLDLDVVVVAGALNPHLTSLRAAAADARSSIRIEIDAENMPELMAWADVAISACGSTSWELAFMGLPALVIVLSENQQVIADGLSRGGWARNLGWHSAITDEQITEALVETVDSQECRQIMSEKGRLLVDGFGPLRVSQKLRSVR